MILCHISYEQLFSSIGKQMLVPMGCLDYMSVSKNTGTPKWMVYNGKPY